MTASHHTMMSFATTSRFGITVCVSLSRGDIIYMNPILAPYEMCALLHVTHTSARCLHVCENQQDLVTQKTKTTATTTTTYLEEGQCP